MLHIITSRRCSFQTILNRAFIYCRSLVSFYPYKNVVVYKFMLSTFYLDLSIIWKSLVENILLWQACFSRMNQHDMIYLFSCDIVNLFFLWWILFSLFFFPFNFKRRRLTVSILLWWELCMLFQVWLNYNLIT